LDPSHFYGLNRQLLIPEGAMTQFDKFEVEHIPVYLPGKSFDACVSDIVNPSDFYIQLNGNKKVLFKIMVNLNQFYNLKSSEKYKIMEIEPGIVGLPCAALYFDEERRKNEGWHRAIITGIYDFDTVEIFYVDYGTNSRVLLNHCRFLDKKFAHEKAQAINVKCGGIKPKETMKGVEPYWTNECNSLFKILTDATNLTVRGQGVVCILMSNLPNQKPELILYDTVTNDLPDGIIINDRLIRDGFAVEDSKWTKHGLLPWQHPYEQLRQSKIIAAEELCEPIETEKSIQGTEKVETCSEIKESVEKVKLWFDTKFDKTFQNPYWTIM